MSWLAGLRRVLGLSSRIRVVGTDLNGNQYKETQQKGDSFRSPSHFLHIAIPIAVCNISVLCCYCVLHRKWEGA